MEQIAEQHLSRVSRQASRRLKAKYRKGNLEHGGGTPLDMSVHQLLEEAINEAIDQLVYLLSLKEKLT